MILAHGWVPCGAEVDLVRQVLLCLSLSLDWLRWRLM